MQKFEFLRQPLLGELAMSRKKKKKKEERKNAIFSGHLRFCQQPRAAHLLRSDQNSYNHNWWYFGLIKNWTYNLQLENFKGLIILITEEFLW